MIKTEKNILIISYLFEPNNSVGAKRAGYWAKNINSLEPSITCDVISTEPNDKVIGVNNYYCIPNPNTPKGLVKDEGVTWKKEITKWLTTSTTHYDVVIMSGSPFMYFSIGKLFQKRGTKVILDFRDPFALNPRFNNSGIKIRIKKYFERKFVKIADKILTVNSVCDKLTWGSTIFSTKFHIIRNGYEDQISPIKNSIINKAEFNIIYPGKLYNDVSSTPLFNYIKKTPSIHFHHFGNSAGINSFERIYTYGIKPYDEILSAIDQSDIGLILTSGKPFESTTKIYDYIYRKKPIWVISNEKIIDDSLSLWPSDCLFR